MKKCPYCAEEVQEEAVICRYCNRDLAKSKSFQVSSGQRDKHQKKGFGQQELKHPLLTGLLIVIAFVLVVAFFVSSDSADKEVADSVTSQEDEVVSGTPEELIKSVVTKELAGTNNADKEVLRDVKVVKQVGGGYGVFIEFNAGDNLTTNLRKAGIERDMSMVYQQLYTQDLNVISASISAYFPLVDQYGNQGDELVYKTILDKAEADRINWNADSSTLKLDIVPGVWTTSVMHPEFQ